MQPITKVRKVTLRDIANSSGFSRMTVSLSLRNDPRISGKTRARIKKVAQTLGYVRNPYLAALGQQIRSSKQSELNAKIAYLSFFNPPGSPCATDQDSKWLEDYYIGAEAQANLLGFGLERLNPWQFKMTAERLNETLKGLGVIGLIIHPSYSQIYNWNLDWDQFSVCVNGPANFKLPFHSTECGRQEGMMLLLEQVQTLGYKRIGLVLQESQDAYHSHVQRCAISDFQIHLPKYQRIPHLIEKVVTKESFYVWLDTFQPELIVAGFDEIYSWMEEKGCSIPAEIGLVRPEITGNRDLSGIIFNRWAVGASAVDLIAGQINRNERGIPDQRKHVAISGIWKEGYSVKRNRCIETAGFTS